MNKIFLVLFVFLAACSSTWPAPVVSRIEPTFTARPSLEPTLIDTPLPITTPTPAISPTSTPIPCDPRTVDYCITDGYFILQRPIKPPANDSVDGTYRYASTANGTRDPHHGVEMGENFGTPVHAAANGVVVFAGPDKEAVYSPWPNFYGNVIVIHHGDDLFTLYAHLSMVEVEIGETVQAGQKIGEVGQSGAATGSHLHFEVRRGEVENYFSTVNPELWLTPSRSEYGVMSFVIVDEAGMLQSAKLTLQHYADSNEILEEYFLDTYDPHMPTNEENAALGDLPAGRYRIALIQNSHLYERWVEVQSGKLTQVMIVIK